LYEEEEYGRTGGKEIGIKITIGIKIKIRIKGRLRSLGRALLTGANRWIGISACASR
jgi:hypothetical protein